MPGEALSFRFIRKIRWEGRRRNKSLGVKRLPLKIVWSVAVGRDDWVTLKIVENDAAAIIKLRSMASQLRRVISKREENAPRSWKGHVSSSRTEKNGVFQGGEWNTRPWRKPGSANVMDSDGIERIVSTFEQNLIFFFFFLVDSNFTIE